MLQGYEKWERKQQKEKTISGMDRFQLMNVTSGLSEVRQSHFSAC